MKPPLTGTELRQLRLAAGLTIDDIVQRLEQFGIYPGKISVLERGKARLTPFTAELLRRAIADDLKPPEDVGAVYRQLFKYEGTDIHQIFHFARLSGWSLDKIFSLQWTAYNYERQTISRDGQEFRVTGKLAKDLAHTFRLWRLCDGPKMPLPNYIFGFKDKPMTKTDFYRDWGRWCKETNVIVTFSDLLTAMTQPAPIVVETTEPHEETPIVDDELAALEHFIGSPNGDARREPAPAPVPRQTAEDELAAFNRLIGL